MRIPTKTEVLIVGAGPVGLALANLLGRLEIETLIIDKAEKIQTHPRAIALDNEALRILQMAGLDEQAFERIPIPEVHLQSPIFGEFARMNTAGTLDGHPRLVTFFQPDLEEALEKRIAEHSKVRSIRNMECESLEQSSTGCVAALRATDGSEHLLSARYVIAADGSHSPIRQQLGIGFDGATYPEDWLIVDALNVPTPIDHIKFHCDPRRPAPHMPAPGNRQRWEFMLHAGESREAMLRPEKVKELLAPWIDSNQTTIERTAVYRFHARTVKQFSLGRVFLVGDAAHVTPPFVGQGLVAGLRDAANLAWKLAWVITGKASENILESYNTERQPHARAMIRLAQLMGRLIMPRNKFAAFIAHGIARAITLTPGLRSLIVDLKIKPRNRFKKGLFMPGQGGKILERGNHLRQIQTSNRVGQNQYSDDMLGSRLLMIGFGIDPRTVLSEQAKATWSSLGGEYWEDTTGELLASNGPQPWLAIVRPDKVIVTDGPPQNADELVRATEVLFNPGKPICNEATCGAA